MNLDPTKTESTPASRLPAAPEPSPAVVPDHQLIRRVGEGAFGEVWLARNVMGTARAVKVVRRSRFHSDEPYEREFSGIRKYEPISRSHDGLVDILQVGRNDAEGYFYYVMELADDAAVEKEKRGEGGGEKARLPGDRSNSPFPLFSSAPVRSPDSYVPRTLRSELETRGRLPVSECLRITLSLSQALAHLHRHNLLHRDIKPSNLIFVEGAPKLADIGLVTDATGARTFVGTEGYIPPEGPNSRQADIYSLGMVLYEISSGKRAKDFPEPSLDLVKGEERAAWLELNAVILKACATDPHQRYRSAEEMHADLSLLQRGKSVMARHTRQRVLSTATKLAAVISILLTTAIVGCLVARRPPTQATLPRQLRVDEPQFWYHAGGIANSRAYDISPDGQRMLFVRGKEYRGLTIWDARTSITRPLNLGVDTNWPNWQGSRIPRWAPDSRRFMAQGGRKISPAQSFDSWVVAMFLVDADTGSTEQIGPELPFWEKALDMCWLPNGQAVTYFDGNRHFHTLSLNGERKLWTGTDFSGDNEHDLSLGGYSPDGRWLLVCLRGDIWLVPHLGGRAMPLTQRPVMDNYPTWGSDGKSVYFVSASEERKDASSLWKVAVDLAMGTPKGSPQEVFKKQGQNLFFPKFVASGQLMYAVQEPETRIWVADANQLDKAKTVVRGQERVLSPDGQTIYFSGETPQQEGIFAIDRNGKGSPRKICNIGAYTTRRAGAFGITRNGLTISPDGELLAFAGNDGGKLGVFTVPIAGGKPSLMAEVPDVEWIYPAWSPDSQWLAYAVEQALYRVSRDGKVREPLATLYKWQGFSTRWSPDGKHISALGYETREDWEGGNRVVGWVVSVADKKLRKVTPDNEPWYKEGLQWHPDSQRLTYFLYDGSNKGNGAKHKWAFLDGRPSEEFIDQEDHWDYLGAWAPDGRYFYFSSDDCKKDGKRIHLYDHQTKQITHGIRSGTVPSWSRDGRTVVWFESEKLTSFEVLENFR